MKHMFSPMFILFAILVIFISITGIYAYWVYAGPIETTETDISTSIGNFKYGLIYITKVEVVGGSYSDANVTKLSDTSISTNIDLNAVNTSTATIEVTFYNSTNVSYYYDETVKVSSDNENIVYTVSDIAQADEVPSKTYKTITLTFSYGDKSNLSNSVLISELNFKFTIDKDSISDIVAETAVDKFNDILNNSYEQLENAMNDRSGWNKGSAVTYIGNVAGADSGDSATINTLFGEEFMSMDLDGDGKTEPITIMIKRENIDNNATTGESYTYTSWGRENTVNGVEMTIYITANDFNNINSGDTVTVYAASFTKLPNTTEWIELIPLTKGTASANSYSGGWGSADSFNTDTWVSDSGAGIKDLVNAIY